MLNQFHFECFSNLCINYFNSDGFVYSFSFLFNKYTSYFVNDIRIEMYYHRDEFYLVYLSAYGLLKGSDDYE